MLKMPIRSCIVCREKQHQKELLRFQCIDKKLTIFSKCGRSFYICKSCVSSDDKKLQKSLNRQCRNNDDYIVQLKEILANGR